MTIDVNAQWINSQFPIVEASRQWIRNGLVYQDAGSWGVLVWYVVGSSLSLLQSDGHMMTGFNLKIIFYALLKYTFLRFTHRTGGVSVHCKPRFNSMPR